MYSEMLRRGHRVTSVHLGRSDGAFAKAVAALGADVVTARTDVGVFRAVSEAQGDVVWHMGLRAGLPARAAKIFRRQSVVWAAQNGLDAQRSPWVMRIDRATVPVVDLIVANSHAAAEHARVSIRARSDCIRVVEGALGDDWLTQSSREYAPEGVVRIAMIGNDRPEKRQEFGLEILRKVLDKRFRVVVYTNDDTRLRRVTDEVPLSVPVEFRAGRQLKPRDLREVDILLHPSDSEGLPTAVLEARSQGCFVVGGDAGDTARYATHVVSRDELGEWVRQLAVAIDVVRDGLEPTPVALNSVSQYVDSLERLAVECSTSTSPWIVGGETPD